eukprot:scaffold33508_cov96-Skeletonema_dohrnii-CCMP3373.AAC.4
MNTFDETCQVNKQSISSEKKMMTKAQHSNKTASCLGSMQHGRKKMEERHNINDTCNNFPPSSINYCCPHNR